MQAALSGYLTIWSVIGVGWLVAHLGVLTETHRRFLSKLAFVIASPLLLFSLMAKASLTHLFASTLVVSVLAILAAALLYLLAARLFFHPDLGGSVIGTLCSAYTNAGNLGLPIAAYVLGDMTWMAPIMLIQVGLLQPAGMAVLDLAAARGSGARLSWGRYLTLPFRNPITVGTLAGLAVNALDLPVPEQVWAPVDLIGAMTVPAMLLAFGISLRLDPLPGNGPHRNELIVILVIKVLAHPLVAFLLASYVFALPLPAVLAVTVIAALPTAQNIYIIAGRYRVRALLARDSIFWSTIVSVPVIVAASTWLR